MSAARNLVRFMAEWNVPDVAITLVERAWHWTDEAQVKFESATVLNLFETSLPAAQYDVRPF
jgi:hypothetical protein